MTAALHRQPLPALKLFQMGHDTLSIASILGITEAEALRQISDQRSALLGLPSPYADQDANLGFRVIHQSSSEGLG